MPHINIFSLYLKPSMLQLEAEIAYTRNKVEEEHWTFKFIAYFSMLLMCKILVAKTFIQRFIKVKFLQFKFY
jgi:hypothetical protein